MSEPDARFVVPGVPKALQRNRHRIVKTKSGSQFIANYLPAESRAEQSAVRLFASLAMKGQPPLEGPLELRMTAFMPIPASWSHRKQDAALSGHIRPTGKPDLSNILKNIEDGISGICYRDDSQIVALHVWKAFSDTPRVVVELRCLTPRPVQPLVGRDIPRDTTGVAPLTL